MTCISMHPPSGSEWTMVFGWTSLDDGDCKEEYSYIVYNNLANIAAYALSPVIGLIRIIVNAFFLYRNEDVAGKEWISEEKGYLKTQIARGVFELLGGGYLLWIPDLIFTIGRACDADFAGTPLGESK